MRAREVAKLLISAEVRPKELLEIAMTEARTEIERIVVMRSKRSIITQEAIDGSRVEFRSWFDAVKFRTEEGGKNDSAFLGDADTVFDDQIVKWKGRGMKIGERCVSNQRPEPPEPRTVPKITSQGSIKLKDHKNGGSSHEGKPVTTKA